jgi:hypothetical protein
MGQITNTSGLPKSITMNLLKMTLDYIHNKQLDKIYDIEI